MAKTVFARKQVKEFPAGNGFVILASAYTIFARLFKNFFVCNRPGNTGYGYG
jgi:hypothetical protein